MASTPNVLYSESGVSVDRCVIITGVGNRIELGLQLLEMNVFESLFNHTISASLVFQDTFNLIANLPICGQEWMLISVSKPGFADPNLPGGQQDVHFTLLLRVFKIEKVTHENPFTQHYVMHLMEEDAINNETVRVARTYTNTRPEAAIKDIFKKDLNYDDDSFAQSFDGEMETSSMAHTFTIPNLKPFAAVNYISSLAINQTLLNDFMFYETTAGYRCDSLTTLFQRPPVLTINYKVKQISLTDNGAIDPYLNSLSPNEIENNVLFDYSKGLAQGEFGINSDLLDISKQRFLQNHQSYDSFLNQKKGKMLNQFGKVPKNDWQELPPQTDDQPMYRIGSVVPTFTGVPRLVTDFNITRMAGRLMQIAAITNQKIKLKMPGTALYKAGATIQLTYPSIASRSEDAISEDLKDKYLNAKYIIVSVRHVINNREWYSYVELSKDSLPKELPEEFSENFTTVGL